MKRAVVVLLVFIMLVTVAGCSGKSYSNVAPQEVLDEIENEVPSGEILPEEGAKLLIWEDDTARIEYMKYVAEEYTKKYGIEVEIEQVVDYTTRMVQDAPYYFGPDILEAPHDQAGTLLTAGLIQPNDTTVEQVKSDFISTVYDCLVYDDKVYGYPQSINTFALIYNKDIVGENLPTSFQDIIDFAETFNDPDKNQYALMWSVGSTYFSHCFIAGYDGYIFGNNGTDPTDIGLNRENAIAGAKYFMKLKNILNVYSADTNDSQVMDGLFGAGKLAYYISGLWTAKLYESLGYHIGVMPLPSMENGNCPRPFMGVQTLYVSAYSLYPNAAKLFAEMASSEEMLRKRFEFTREIPAMTSLMDSEEVKNDEIVSAFMKQASFAVPMPSIPEMGVVWNPYSSALQSMWDLGTDPQEAMNTCTESIKTFIEMQK